MSDGEHKASEVAKEGEVKGGLAEVTFVQDTEASRAPGGSPVQAEQVADISPGAGSRAPAKRAVTPGEVGAVRGLEPRDMPTPELPEHLEAE